MQQPEIQVTEMSPEVAAAVEAAPHKVTVCFHDGNFGTSRVLNLYGDEPFTKKVVLQHVYRAIVQSHIPADQRSTEDLNRLLDISKIHITGVFEGFHMPSQEIIGPMNLLAMQLEPAAANEETPAEQQVH